MKKNNRSRLLVFALAAALFVAAAVPAYAAMAAKNIDVFTGVSIFVDGRELHPADATGNDVEAFIYEGTTYVPLRAENKQDGMVFAPVWQVQYREAGTEYESWAEFNAVSGELLDASFL